MDVVVELLVRKDTCSLGVGSRSQLAKFSLKLDNELTRPAPNLVKPGERDSGYLIIYIFTL